MPESAKLGLSRMSSAKRTVLLLEVVSAFFFLGLFFLGGELVREGGIRFFDFGNLKVFEINFGFLKRNLVVFEDVFFESS